MWFIGNPGLRDSGLAIGLSHSANRTTVLKILFSLSVSSHHLLTLNKAQHLGTCSLLVWGFMSVLNDVTVSLFPTSPALLWGLVFAWCERSRSPDFKHLTNPLNSVCRRPPGTPVMESETLGYVHTLNAFSWLSPCAGPYVLGVAILYVHMLLIVALEEFKSTEHLLSCKQWSDIDSCIVFTIAHFLKWLL